MNMHTAHPQPRFPRVQQIFWSWFVYCTLGMIFVSHAQEVAPQKAVGAVAPSPMSPATEVSEKQPDALPPVEMSPAPPPAPVFLPGEISTAESPKAYRKDAAGLLYAKFAARIYKGKMPPLLYAVGVLDIEIDGRGKIERIQWLRAPSHAPEVVTEIERMVRAVAPFPVPVKMGRVVYTEIWLWHKSGLFQLDTLTEGQY